MEFIEHLVNWLVQMVAQFGYGGLFLVTLVEAIPFPAELIIIPAGYLVEKGELNFILVILASTLGVTCGATLNYWLARKFGRELFVRFGKYVMLNDSKLAKLERFFMTHGPVSIFLGRLVPRVRHYLFVPAGLGAMPPKKFAFLHGAGRVAVEHGAGHARLPCRQKSGVDAALPAHHHPRRNRVYPAGGGGVSVASGPAQESNASARRYVINDAT